MNRSGKPQTVPRNRRNFLVIAEYSENGRKHATAFVFARPQVGNLRNRSGSPFIKFAAL